MVPILGGSAPQRFGWWQAIPEAKSTSGIQVEVSCKDGYNRVRQSRTGVRWT